MSKLTMATVLVGATITFITGDVPRDGSNWVSPHPEIVQHDPGWIYGNYYDPGWYHGRFWHGGRWHGRFW